MTATTKPTLWQRIRARVRRVFAGESVGPDDWGYPVHPYDLFDGQKGIDHSLLSLIAAWRKRLPGAAPPPAQAVSRDYVRDLARQLELYNPFAQSMLSALRSYVLGEQGLHVELAVKEGQKPTSNDEMLLSVTDDFLNDWLDREDWWGRERELYVRCHRDGEGILRYFASRDGIRVRFIEPECVVPPDATPAWSEGVRTDPDDAETLEALWVQTGITPRDGEEVTADEVYFIRSNADRCLKRGLSDFASVAALVTKALECLSSMIGTESIRQAIVMITHHDASSPADLDQMVAAQTDYYDRSGGQRGTAREVPTQGVTGQHEIHLSGQQRLAAAPPGAIQDATNAINTALLSVGSRYHMPLWVISGDASRNNALDLQAEGPFGRFIKDEAVWFARHVRNVLWRVLQIAADRGEIPQAALEALDLHVTPQQVTEQRDPTRQTAQNKMLFDAGIMGKPTWTAKEGLDFEDEQDDLRRYGGPPPAEGNGKLPAKPVPPARDLGGDRVRNEAQHGNGNGHASQFRWEDSYFKECDRDEKGHCSAGAGGGALEKPDAGAGGGMAAPQDDEAAREKEDGQVEAAREKEDGQVEAAREKEDAAAAAQDEREDAQVEKTRAAEDAATEKAREAQDAAAEKAQEQREAAREKFDAQTEKQQQQEDKQLEKARAAEDKQVEKAREKEDDKLSTQRDKEDDRTNARRDKEDEKVQAKRDKEDEKLEAFRDAQDEQDGPPNDARLEERYQEDKAWENARDPEDEAVGAARTVEDNATNARRTAEDEQLQGDRGTEDDARAAGRAQEDEGRAAQREQEQDARTAARDGEDAQAEAAAAATLEARTAEDGARQSQRDAEDQERWAAQSARGDARTAARDAEDEGRAAQREKEDEVAHA